MNKPIKAWLVRLIYVLIATEMALVSPLVHADQQTLRVSRYVTVNAAASEAQKDPLNAVIPNLTFPRQVVTVFDALQTLLNDSGYRIATFHPDVRVHQLFNLALPAIHRQLGPISLENALNTLSGSPWMLAVDPINRLVTFQLPRHYKTPRVYTTPQVAKVSYPPEINGSVKTVSQTTKQRQVTGLGKQRVSKRRSTKKQQVKNYRRGLKNFLDQSLQSPQRTNSNQSEDDWSLLVRVAEVLQ